MGEKYIRKRIQEILQEAFGVSFGVDELILWLVPEFIQRVVDGVNNGKYNFNGELTPPLIDFIVPEPLSDKTKIFLIRIHTDISDDYPKMGGAFIPGNTEQHFQDDIAYYLIYIELRFNWNFIRGISNNLHDVLSHELHHAFDYTLRFGKQNKSKSLNYAQNKIKTYVANEEIYTNTALKEFIKCFYLALPEEINARVQETNSAIKPYLNFGIKSLIGFLRNKQPLRDAMRMKKFDIETIINLPDNIKTEFITEFNSNILDGLATSGVLKKDWNYGHKNPNQFFEYWSKRINDNGEYLRRKIMNVVYGAKQKYIEGLIEELEK